MAKSQFRTEGRRKERREGGARKACSVTGLREIRRGPKKIFPLLVVTFCQSVHIYIIFIIKINIIYNLIFFFLSCYIALAPRKAAWFLGFRFILLHCIYIVLHYKQSVVGFWRYTKSQTVFLRQPCKIAIPNYFRHLEIQQQTSETGYGKR